MADSAVKVRAYKRTQKWFRLNPEKRREYNRRYYAKNAEKRRETARLDRLKNPDRVRAHNVRFREKHPTYLREYRQRRRVRDAFTNWSRSCAASRRRLLEAA